MSKSIKCPHCGSGSVKKSSAVYEQGTSSYQSSGSSSWVSKKNFGSSTRRSSGTRQTAAAKKNAPTAGTLECAVFVISLFGSLFGLFFLRSAFSGFYSFIFTAFIIATVITSVVAYLNREGRKNQAENYKRQWYCTKCGENFLRVSE